MAAITQPARPSVLPEPAGRLSVALFDETGDVVFQLWSHRDVRGQGAASPSELGEH